MDREPLDTGRIYTVSASLAALTTAANEILSLVASSNSRVEILSLALGQPSSAGITPMAVDLFRGTSASTGGSTGAALAPINRNGWAAAPAAVSAVAGPSTTPNSTSNSVRLHAGSLDADSGQFRWEPKYPPTLDVLQRFTARLTPLTTAVLTGMAATLTFREVGKVPS